ncbi:MAG: aminoglycoside phosphotransferase family protein [Bryobacterales bacterium]|nr:aminoglycoside phosphotransferase family protein [Bryobacteraceae bacterium]MDW8354508.1 aminoglycoside phosphotransferase family protein [Bryobacterales bacterium]
MLELDASNVAAVLDGQEGWEGGDIRITPLGGGVSNTVLLVEGARQRLVLKQSLAKLRVEQDWFSDRSRVYREAAALRWLAGRLPAGSVPAVVFEDRDNFLFAMTAAPSGARTWKSLLLEGCADRAVAVQVGRLLAAIIRASWQEATVAAAFGDQTVFDQLRLDPYYRATAARHPDLAPFFDVLIRAYPEQRYCLVHGDWSPKNFLVWDHGVMAIDFEVAHFGDPAFDAAFLLNHLLLKSFHRPVWQARYAELAQAFWMTLSAELPEELGDFEARVVRHWGGLLLARIDGKSPVEYIRDESVKQAVRTFARGLIAAPPAHVMEVFERRAA